MNDHNIDHPTFASTDSHPVTPSVGDATDAQNRGDNGNPAQSAGRVTAQEQDENPAGTIESEDDEKDDMADERQSNTPMGQH